MDVARLRVIPLLALLCVACAGSADRAGGPAAAGWSIVEAREHVVLDSMLAAVLRETGSPAVAAAVVRGDSMVASGAAGVRRLGTAERVDLDDRFFLGSVAKAMTATLIGWLVEQGTLSWGTTPAAVFPELADGMDPALRAITLEQLLAHTAGLANFNPGTPEWEALPPLEGSGQMQRRGFTAWVLARPPAREPGSGFLYSNAGAPIAAAMAERVTGVTWEALMREHVFEPLGIETAGYGWPAGVDPNEPWGHWEEGGELQPHDPSGEYRLPPWIAPAGDIHMSVIDFARFAAAHLAGLRGDATLLRPESVRHLHSPIVVRTERIDHALGWHVWSAEAGPRAGRSFHGGGGGTFVAFIEISREENLAFVVLTNDGREPSRTLSATLGALEQAFGSGGADPPGR